MSQAGVTSPRTELAMVEVHDCFTPTEIVLTEDLGLAERGTGWKEVLAGTFDLDGDLRSTRTAGSRRSATRSGRRGCA
jgi:acetyl-CoA C-acetyltransferase